MSDYTGWIVVEQYEDGLLLAPKADAPSAVLIMTQPTTIQPPPQIMNQFREVEMDQTTIEQMTSLDWVYDRDIQYYHRNCPGRVEPASLLTTEEMKVGICTACGMKIESTLSHPSITYPENRARIA